MADDRGEINFSVELNWIHLLKCLGQMFAIGVDFTDVYLRFYHHYRINKVWALAFY